MPARKNDIARLKRVLAEAKRIKENFDRLAKEVNASELEAIPATHNKEHRNRRFNLN